MKRICSIYKSPRKNEMYLYVLKLTAWSACLKACCRSSAPPCTLSTWCSA